MKKEIKSLAIWMLFLIVCLFIGGLVGIAEAQPAAFTLTAMPMVFGIVVGGRVLNQKIFNWEKILDIPAAERKEAILDAFNKYLNKQVNSPIPGVEKVKMTGADSNLQGVTPIVLVMSDIMKMIDRGYEMIFGLVDMRNSTNKSFEMLDISGAVTFYQQLEGEEAKLSKIPTSAKTSVSMLRFTGGFPILDDWLKYNEFYKIDELASDTELAWWDQKAAIFYGMLVALTGIDQAFATDDVTTINNACANILVDLRAAGYKVNESSQFVITCNPLQRARILKAIAASFTNANTNNNQIVYPISAVVTTTQIAATSYYVSLPGGKNKRGEWEDLNARPPQRNELKLGADHVWTGGYNGIIGEKKQHKKLALS